MQDSSQTLSAAFKANYASSAASVARRKAFYALRFGSSSDTLGTAAVNAMVRGTDEMAVIRGGFWYDQFGSVTCPSPEFMSADAIGGVATAFRDAILQYCS
ncbi:hypothetical protein OG194_16270 [Streptomyces sp. NBC_01288]|uniref:hypothetical protein n=1 Tax=Streptomyces sp. NBC_01288 TaxID=2903814 RepID=UPI002E16000F|nr:hypothetical protein OG194_16270 [Streptomyces sp. NBC_01288]